MRDIEDILPNHEEPTVGSAPIRQFAAAIVRQDASRPIETEEQLHLNMRRLAKKFKVMPSKKELRSVVVEMGLETGTPLSRLLIHKRVRSRSGIVNVSVVLPPDRFSCAHDCKFCPKEPGMPRSYLSNEDAVARAASVGFDAIRQVDSRLRTLEQNGHPLDKIEFRILGGTFSNYPHETTEAFIRDLFYAANTFAARQQGGGIRPPASLEEEQQENTDAEIHVVGLGLETRPDTITASELWRFRKLGCTRVEIGVQHTNDLLLRRCGRGHGVRHSREAVRLLKDHGFKVEMHIMLDLPGTTPEMDMECYDRVLREDPELYPDYLKDYPCLDVPFTEIRKWKQDGRWIPYSEEPGARRLRDVLVYRMSITPKWVRVNRIQRDFREADERNGFLGYESMSIMSNLAQVVRQDARERGIECLSIRCREIGDTDLDPLQSIRFEKEQVYSQDGAAEFFFSAHVQDKLLGFCRLRLTEGATFPVLRGRVGIIRELHVYGPVVPVSDKIRGGAPQHRGVGTALLRMAEDEARSRGAHRLAVIAGVGVRSYYGRLGYRLEDTYMVKDVPWHQRGWVGWLLSGFLTRA